MNRILVTLTILVVGALATSAFAQERLGGVVAHWGGTVIADYACGLPGCAGDLLECQPGEVMTQAKAVFTFQAGVCDDAGETPCNGRLTAFTESCYIPANDTKVFGHVYMVTGRGSSRICFDEAGTSDCTGSTPTGIVVGKGDFRWQSRGFLAGYFPQETTAGVTYTMRKPFKLDGEGVKIKARAAIEIQTGQPDMFSDSCVSLNGSPGCGFVGTSVSKVIP